MEGHRSRPRRAIRPLDSKRLDELALRYVGRFATTRAKLATYLKRKLRERGWEGPGQPDLDALADRFVGLGYIDDRAFALAKAASHNARGLGHRRLTVALSAAGIDDADRSDALQVSRQDAVESALRFARRKRIGPFGDRAGNSPKDREKALAAMVRAGHDFDLSKAVLVLQSNDDDALDLLRERFSHTDE